MIKNCKKNRGFTLMETLIYIALFGIIMSGAVVGTYNLLEGGNRNIDSSRIEEEGTFLSRKISYSLTGSVSAVVSNGSSTLVITKSDGTTVTLSGDGSNMTIAEGSGVAIPLNNDRFQVTNVDFIYTASVNDRPPAISATFQVAGKPFTYKDYIRQ